MLLNSKINLKLVQETLEKLEQAPYFSEQLDVQQTEVTHRKTYSFGYNYFSMHKDDFMFTHIPSYIKELCQACIDSFPKELKLGKAEDYKNVIVSFYEPGYLLEPHVDVAEERFTEGREVNFHFGKDIMGVILRADSEGRLYFVKTEDEEQRCTANKIFELDEQPGTTFVMHGASRYRPYYHGVSRVKDSRISVTFRSVEIG